MTLPGEDPGAIEVAAEAIREGRLVGMPTETVYGIAADALSEDAVRSIFSLKGRPADNPLIVHLASADGLAQVASDVPPRALALAKRFWPGPLTIVLPKLERVPGVTTGGLDTVAVRVPDHAVALALLSAVGTPLAAPSANRFTGLSPTRAEDIEPSLARGLACILDGGPCRVGIESTVLDLSEDAPAILRLGAITSEDISKFLGVEIGVGLKKRSPGMNPRHYAPRTPVRLVDRLAPDAAGLTFARPENENQFRMSAQPAEYAAELYGALAQLDRRGLKRIDVQLPPHKKEWVAIVDRLRRAAEDHGD